MDLREQKGLAIATHCNLTKKGWFWYVPSQSGACKYTVMPNSTDPHCSCPDHETRGVKCKHIWAVEFAMKAQANPDGTATVTQTVTITEKRKTYPQAWAAYNAAQTNEKAKFQQLLNDLCSRVQDLPRAKTGRQRLPLADVIFSVAYKVYSTFSGRRFMTDLRDAFDRGYISKLPHYNSIFNYLEMPELTPILKQMIETSCQPLKTVETKFAADSTGFATTRFVRWFDAKYGKDQVHKDWVKCHLTCGVKTNIVTSVEISQAGDSPMFAGMVKDTAKLGFKIDEFSADKAYSSQANLQTVVDVGGTPFIPFKSSTTGALGGLWEKMYHYFSFKREEFCQHYHLRSNVESTYSMIKAKFRDHVRSKTDTAMANEVLCKLLCHNICCVIQSMYELGIEPNFFGESESAQKLTILPINAR
jgi:transposase